MANIALPTRTRLRGGGAPPCCPIAASAAGVRSLPGSVKRRTAAASWTVTRTRSARALAHGRCLQRRADSMTVASGRRRGSWSGVALTAGPRCPAYVE